MECSYLFLESRQCTLNIGNALCIDILNKENITTYNEDNNEPHEKENDECY